MGAWLRLLRCCNLVPCGAVIAFNLAVWGTGMGAQATQKIRQATRNARLPKQERKRNGTDSLRWVRIGLTFVTFVNIVAVFSLVLSRVGCHRNRCRRENVCGHLMSRPIGLYFTWIFSMISFLAQLALVVVHSNSFLLLLVLEGMCLRDTQECKSTFSEELQSDFAVIDTQAYCDGHVEVAKPARNLVMGLMITVISQALMASSLSGECERISSELHYQEGAGRVDEGLGATEGAEDPAVLGKTLKKQVMKPLRAACSLCPPCCFICLPCCMPLYQTVNSEVPEGQCYNSQAAKKGRVHLIINALDYNHTNHPLTATADAENMQHLAEACKIPESNVTVMLNEECTKENVIATIRRVASQCHRGDFFVYYYSGHGTNIKDENGDEEDGQDEAFCFVTPDGRITTDSVMIDDDFAELVGDAVEPGVWVVVLTDCCHSGSICDFDNPAWDDHTGISITGCLDGQTAGDTGAGGIMTHSMLCAIASLSENPENQHTYSSGKLYNETLRKDDRIFGSRQDITLQCTPGTTPGNVPWPLVPVGRYEAPQSKFDEDKFFTRPPKRH